jgi:hypothetical protein
MKICRKLYIPIYDVDVWVVVDKTIDDARNKLSKVFDRSKDEGTYDQHNGLCISQGTNFGLCFSEQSSKNACIVSHEVFHLTHRILEYHMVNFDSENHEPAAILNGYLSARIHGILKLKPKPCRY